METLIEPGLRGDAADGLARPRGSVDAVAACNADVQRHWDSTSTTVVQPVVLAGGVGTRLWPLSRTQDPKQFVALHGARSLFQQATDRMQHCAAGSDVVMLPPCVVCNEEHRFLVLDQLHQVGAPDGAVLLEPVGRNTAAAMTLAALHATEDGADPVLVVTPSDQTVTEADEFVAAVRNAIRVAANGAIVLLGVEPDRPETGYGYIRVADTGDFADAMPILQFLEKPDLATARRCISGHDHYWNSGLFVVRASVWLAALERHRRDIADTTRVAWNARKADAGFMRPGPVEFARIPSESIDYAVMVAESSAAERRFELRMVPLRAGWNDLGSWQAVWQVSDKDEGGNASRGDVLLFDSRNTLVHSTGRLVAVVGLDDVVVVETADAVLVVSRERAQEVKHIVGELQRRGRSEHALHRKVHRPWGWYDGIDAGVRFQVKRIVVKPGASLSLQMHHHRAEHWIVVSGTAEVTCGDRKTLITENQSTYIPLGQTHRLANPGKMPLEIIEVQSGSYLGEDDIVRFQDTYGRG